MKTQHFITPTVIAISTSCVFGQETSKSDSSSTEKAKHYFDVDDLQLNKN